MSLPRAGRPRVALVLPGGGARSAYQVGVLKAIASWYPAGSALPFPVLCGTSAGAINAAVLAAQGADFKQAGAELARVWAGFRTGQVFRAGTFDMLHSGLRLFGSLATGGLLLPVPHGLLDSSPLAALLRKNIDFDALRRNVVAGCPDSIAITATSLTAGDSVTFVETSRPFEAWHRAGRRGVAASINADHLMASAAIPLLFPPIAMDGAHYNDGATRQSTPLAPAIHAGADRILILAVRHPGRTPVEGAGPPNMAEQFGSLLDALFMEGLQTDLERLNRINVLLARQAPGPSPGGMRHVDTLLVQPSEDPSEIAVANAAAMPAPLRALLRILGARGARGGRLLSYLLFESAYTQQLIAAGERDANRRRFEIGTFIGLDG